MVKFELNGSQYQTPNGWNEIECGVFLDYLSNIAPKMPSELKELFELENIEEGYAELRANKKKFLSCLEFFSLCIAFWCKLDQEIIRDSMNTEQLEQAYWAIQIDLNINNLKEDKKFTGFFLNGVEYLCPQRHMAGATVAEFCDACHFEEKYEELKGGEWEALLDVMVVLCRPKGEHYDYNETKHNIRKKQFRKLKMTDVANVGFFLLKLNKQLNLDLLIYSLLELEAVKECEQLEKHTAGF